MLFYTQIKKQAMKKFYLAATLASGIAFFSSCGNNEAGENKSTDSSATTIPAPDNSSATNPSMADTAFSKDHSDTLKVKKDSTNRQ
jgi:PBP1b-binding outer membrane lipoprotein LpoB